MSAGEEVASRLARLLDREGPPLLDEAARACELLAELLPRRRREVWLVAVALDLCLHADLLALDRGASPEPVIQDLSRRLERERCIKAWAAAWTVKTLAAALGLAVDPPGDLAEDAGGPPPPTLAERYQAMESVPPGLLYRLEHDPDRLATRIIDLFCPVGRGQRCLVMGGRRGGKTTLLQDMARGFAANHEELWLAGLQIGYRPEEGQALQDILGNGVFAVADDPASTVEVADCLLEDAVRLAMQGYDAVLLVDSLTHLARAYAASSRQGEGAVQAGAAAVSRFFRAGRNLKQGGSVTIVGAALLDGSTDDQRYLEALHESANSWITLDRDLIARRVYPNILVARSETREEERLLPGAVLRASHWFREQLCELPPGEVLERLRLRMNRHPRNRLMLEALWAGER